MPDSTCSFCNRSMLTSGGCDPHGYRLRGNGRGDIRLYPALPYGSVGELDAFRGLVTPRVLETLETEAANVALRCEDCGCLTGHYHHDGCRFERCPRCSDAYLGCDCEWKPVPYRFGPGQALIITHSLDSDLAKGQRGIITDLGLNVIRVRWEDGSDEPLVVPKRDTFQID